MPLSPGDLLADHYRIEAEIGRGSYGRVYRATETRLNVVRAIKEVAKDIDDLGASRFAEYVRRFEREARIQAGFNHPNIVHVYELLRLGDYRLYLVMECVDGESLRDYLARRSPLPIDEVVRIASDFLTGLAAVYADPRDIVHRDIKPSNVLLTRDGHAKLTDFGLAQVGDESMRSGTDQPHPGSPLYMSPEQETTSAYLYPASDVFSAGCVLFEILTGVPYKRAKKERKGLGELRPDTPSWLAEAVATALAPNMENRPADAGKLAQLLSEGYAKAQTEARAKIEAEERDRAAAQAKQKEEAAKRERQEQLLGLYAVLTTDLKAKRWAEAIQVADEILAIDRDYRDVARLRTRVEGKLRSEQEKAQREQHKAKTGPRPWRLALIGAASVLAVAVLLGVLAVPQRAPLHAWLFGATLTPTVVPTLAPTDTPAPVAQITPAAPDTATAPPQPSRAPAATTSEPTQVPAQLPSEPTPSLWAVPTAMTSAIPGPMTQSPIPSVTAGGGQTLGVGSTWTSPVDGMILVYIPEGEFTMGSTDGDTEADNDEKPQHKVTLDAYWIDRTEVTKAQYQRCVQAGECDLPSCSGTGQADHPVVCVSWIDAVSYCTWAGRRLPTEAEWEKAARGTDGRKYPWGNQSVTGTRQNFCDVNCTLDWKDSTVNDGYSYTAPVGVYPRGASPYGALDMAGNVWEWVADWANETFYHTSPMHNPQAPDAGLGRVLRGGGWNSSRANARAADRNRNGAEVTFDFLGFRCARS